MLKKADIFIIIFFIVSSISILIIFSPLRQKKGDKIIITIDGNLYRTVDIADKETEYIDIDGGLGHNRIEIGSNGVRMTEADCPDGICLKHLPISKNTETIVCLPHKLVIEVISGNELEVDAVVQ